MNEVLRLCCVCRTKQNKRNMTRITKQEDGVTIDNNKQTLGKAVYVCPNCKETLIKKKVLNRAFRCNISQEQYDKLSEEFGIADAKN